jgi:hypothetical protein
MIQQIVLSPVSPLAVGLALTWFDLISCEPFDRLTYALEYARGHVAQSLWTQAQAAEFVQRAWQNHLPELLARVIALASITIGLLFVQRYWRRRRTARP